MHEMPDLLDFVNWKYVIFWVTVDRIANEGIALGILSTLYFKLRFDS